LGFHGAFGDELGEDDEAYPNYSILYESNVFTDSDFTGMAKGVEGVVDTREAEYREDAASPTFASLVASGR